MSSWHLCNLLTFCFAFFVLSLSELNLLVLCCTCDRYKTPHPITSCHCWFSIGTNSIVQYTKLSFLASSITKKHQLLSSRTLRVILACFFFVCLFLHRTPLNWTLWPYYCIWQFDIGLQQKENPDSWAKQSHLLQLNTGVPQGCVLSPFCMHCETVLTSLACSCPAQTLKALQLVINTIQLMIGTHPPSIHFIGFGKLSAHPKTDKPHPVPSAAVWQ